MPTKAVLEEKIKYLEKELEKKNNIVNIPEKAQIKAGLFHYITLWSHMKSHLEEAKLWQAIPLNILYLVYLFFIWSVAKSALSPAIRFGAMVLMRMIGI